ncbi:hypothetical protein EC912_10784 [Luteibacter rhizovicinus]|uniref:Uncharacterized protein n=1 Tax=Luteibacter rhizovicinus TaxID=242606 RepID=A0A4R3YIY6_9GAMM|nr:DUF6081 family protein [Luteibacter rhizovicinus]TCV92377.1 hypothetical protein EC912_10784 [Luteibacter rhizovicinus]
MIRKVTILLTLVLILLAPGIAFSQNKLPYVALWDDFHRPFSIDASDARWFYFTAGSYVGDDGIVSTGPHGLRVVSTGLSPYSGEPAFTRTIGQEHENGGLPGALDHVKWLAFMNHTASTGLPGFDAVPGQTLSCAAIMGGQTFGTKHHPFGNNVIDADDDLRLASVAQTVLDFESFIVFDFFITNKHIYAYYERLPFGRTAMHNYAAFAFAIPVADYRPGDVHRLRIAYDRSARLTRWLVDEREVYRVDRIGRLIDRDYMTIDLGGIEEDVAPRQLDCGMGTFTLLDGHLPSDRGLVRLSEAPYFNPEFGAPVPENFADNLSLYVDRIFGQGAELKVKRYSVSSIPSFLDP